MKITIEQLEKHNACEEGIGDFLKMFTSGIADVEWTYEKQIEIIQSPLRKYIGWAVYEKLIPLYFPTDVGPILLKLLIDKIRAGKSVFPEIISFSTET